MLDLRQAQRVLMALQVGDALLDVIFDPEEADGVGLIIDGFPRTALQVSCVVCRLVDSLHAGMSAAAAATCLVRRERQ